MILSQECRTENDDQGIDTDSLIPTQSAWRKFHNFTKIQAANGR